ncbi:MAG: hypothetical protein HUJ68_01280 [Clostridia bacterium]|nr:hypothetical protein [Clostridia bacterium]
MSNGNYGTIRPADFNITDAEMYYSYSANRNEATTGFTKYELTEDILTKSKVNDDVLGGMYSLNLPSTTFNQVGIYTIYIRPKQVEVDIKDVSVLSTNPDIRGIVISTEKLTDEMKVNGGMVGYRIEYKKNNGEKVNNLFRVITSNNSCIVNTNSNGAKNTTYTIDSSSGSNLMFITVTPSTANSVNANSLPYIGENGDTLLISNTSFDPIMLEIEYTNYDMDSIANLINGTTTRSIEDGIITIYDTEGNIQKQFDTYQVKNADNEPIYYVKKERENIDTTKNLNNITRE